MKFYIQQTALDRLNRTAMKMDSTGCQTTQISLEPKMGFVEVTQSDANHLRVIKLKQRILSAIDTLKGIDADEMHDEVWAAVMVAIEELEGK
jgi:hypothetical protein